MISHYILGEIKSMIDLQIESGYLGPWLLHLGNIVYKVSRDSSSITLSFFEYL